MNRGLTAIGISVVALLAAGTAADTISAQGADPVSNTPAEFRQFFREEVARWAKLVKDTGIKGD